MRTYDPTVPVTIFLGPSLAHDRAQEILSGNYYPPARLGDIYNLLGTGVETIILIDGIFHSTPSVWQRELLTAVSQGIKVIGASSMGALRAAELCTFGVIGCGTIFGWYKSGTIDGDDEVALIHEDESKKFRKLSEPLVNIRHNLAKAAEQKYITVDESVELVAYSKKFSYWHRSYNLLFQSQLAKTWTTDKQKKLRDFFKNDAVDLKKQDAINVLHMGKDLMIENKSEGFKKTDKANDIIPYLKRSFYFPISIYKRGLFNFDGHLIAIAEDVLRNYLRDKDSTRLETLRYDLSQRYFLLQYAIEANLRPTKEYFDNFKNDWKTKYISNDEYLWLRSNGLTSQEFESMLETRGLLKWIIEQDLDDFGLAFKHQSQLVTSLVELSPNRETNYESLIRSAKTNYCVGTWARKRGISCPASETETFIQKWTLKYGYENYRQYLELAEISEETLLSILDEWSLVHWISLKSPNYFGFRNWNPKVAIFQELQMTGEAAAIANKTLEHKVK